MYKRSRTGCKPVWYYYAYDEKGIRTVAKSTGQTTKAAAERFCHDLWERGELLTYSVTCHPEKRHESPVEQKKTSGTFSKFARGWWEWDSCPYVLSQKARGTERKPGIKKSYADWAKLVTQAHLVPYFGRMQLMNIRPKDVETWMAKMRNTEYKPDRKYTPKTINLYRGVLNIMLIDAAKNRLIENNPCQHVKSYKTDKVKRDLLTEEEFCDLFSDKNFTRYWKGEYAVYAGNLFAALTGMRLGEIRGLQRADIEMDRIHVHSAYTDEYKLSTTKTSEDRYIPLTPRMRRLLERVMASHHNKFVFCHPLSGTKGTTPCHNLSEMMYHALDMMGIDKDEREKRKLTFHSWRHYFNTQCVKNDLQKAQIQVVTGHKTDEMTEHYTDISFADVKEQVLHVQEGIFGLLDDKKKDDRGSQSMTG